MARGGCRAGRRRKLLRRRRLLPPLRISRPRWRLCDGSRRYEYTTSVGRCRLVSISGSGARAWPPGNGSLGIFSADQCQFPISLLLSWIQTSFLRFPIKFPGILARGSCEDEAVQSLLTTRRARDLARRARLGCEVVDGRGDISWGSGLLGLARFGRFRRRQPSGKCPNQRSRPLMTFSNAGGGRIPNRCRARTVGKVVMP